MLSFYYHIQMQTSDGDQPFTRKYDRDSGVTELVFDLDYAEEDVEVTIGSETVKLTLNEGRGQVKESEFEIDKFGRDPEYSFNNRVLTLLFY